MFHVCFLALSYAIAAAIFLACSKFLGVVLPILPDCL